MRPLDFDFLKNRYDFELQRREQQTASLGLPVAVLGGLGSLIALMARSFSWSDWRTTVPFGPFLILDIIAFIACMVFLSRVYHRQTYVYLPKLVDLDNALEEWREFYKEAKAQGADDDYFGLEFRKRIIDATDRNTDINDERSAQLYRARVCFLSVLWLTAIASVPYVADQLMYANDKTRTSSTATDTATDTPPTEHASPATGLPSEPRNP